MTFKMNGLVQFASSLVDGSATRSETVALQTSLASGTGAGQANNYWSGTLTIAAGDSATLDFLGLVVSAFGASGTTAFESVKHLVVVNQSGNVTLTVEPGASNGWDQLGETVVGKGGVLVLHSPVAGLGIGGTSRTIKVSNNDTVTTLTGETSTGSGATIVTGLSSTSGLAVGMTITGAGIPAGAKIASITNSTTLVMTANATATSGSGGVSLDFAWPAAVVNVYVAGILD